MVLDYSTGRCQFKEFSGIYLYQPVSKSFEQWPPSPCPVLFPSRTEVSKGFPRTLSSEELSGDVESFASDDDDLLAAKKLLGDDAGQAAKEMALAIDDDLLPTKTPRSATFQFLPRCNRREAGF